MTLERLKELYDSKAITIEEYDYLLDRLTPRQNHSETIQEKISDSVIANFEYRENNEYFEEESNLDIVHAIMETFDMTWASDYSESKYKEFVPTKEDIKKHICHQVEDLCALIKENPNEKYLFTSSGRFKLTATQVDDEYEESDGLIPEGKHCYTFTIEFIPCAAESNMFLI